MPQVSDLLCVLARMESRRKHFRRFQNVCVDSEGGNRVPPRERNPSRENFESIRATLVPRRSETLHIAAPFDWLAARPSQWCGGNHNVSENGETPRSEFAVLRSDGES